MHFLKVLYGLTYPDALFRSRKCQRCPVLSSGLQMWVPHNRADWSIWHDAGTKVTPSDSVKPASNVPGSRKQRWHCPERKTEMDHWTSHNASSSAVLWFIPQHCYIFDSDWSEGVDYSSFLIQLQTLIIILKIKLHSPLVAALAAQWTGVWAIVCFTGMIMDQHLALVKHQKLKCQGIYIYFYTLTQLCVGHVNLQIKQFLLNITVVWRHALALRTEPAWMWTFVPIVYCTYSNHIILFQ